MKKREINYYKKHIRYTKYKKLLRSYAEIENKLKMMEENVRIKDSQISLKIYKRNL